MDFQQTTLTRLSDRLRRARREALKPPPKLDLIEWADTYRQVSKKNSANPGQWKTSRVPAAYGPYLAVTEKDTHTITVMASTQMLKTEFLLQVAGYFIHQDPGSILFVQPTQKLAEDFSKERFAPTRESTPVLRELIPDAKSRDSGVTITHKALALDTPIPTPSGWSTMGELSVGDSVFDERGQICRVIETTEVFDSRECYRVVFSDGESIVADAGHLWAVEARGGANRLVSKLLTTEEINRSGCMRGGRRRFSVMVADPIKLEPAELPIDPYLLGAWLGDGFSHSASIVAGLSDLEMRDHLAAAGAFCRTEVRANRVYVFSLDDPQKVAGRGDDGRLTAREDTIRSSLRRLGVLNSKHIPAIYLRGSYDQRLALLQGLMDTDGSVDSRGICRFVTADRYGISGGFEELLSSLGLRFSVHKARNAAWYSFYPRPQMPVFRLSRKLKQQKNRPNAPKRTTRRQVVSVEKVESVPVRCISVDSGSHLFLAGRKMVPTHNSYPGGTLDFVGANSPVDLASRPKRIVLSDEIDKYPASAGSEGDPLSLAEERSSTFWNRKRVRACSPTDEVSSRIYKEFQQSDQRRCYVGCPHCGHEQTLHWSRETVMWERDAAGNHLAETARYYCQSCGAGWSEAERVRALRGLVDAPDHGWRQTRKFMCCGVEHVPSVWTDEGRSLCPICNKASHYTGHAGFHVSKLYSTRHKLADLVHEWLGSHKDREKLRKFVNTGLAEVWKEKVERLDPAALAARCEPYSAESVPEHVRLVVFGADTQDDRIEVTFVGYGSDEECWVLRHDVLHGDTAKKKVWDDLDALLKEPFLSADGRRLNVQAGCIDSQGHRGEMVHAFCRSRKSRRIYPVKGQANDPRGSKLIWPKTPSRTKNSGDKLYLVGVDTAKDALASRLLIDADAEGRATPFAVHFPQTGLSADYFEQLTAEHAVNVTSNGREYRVWRPKAEGLRNEALDCFVYSLAARLSLPNQLKSRPGVADRRPIEPVKPDPDPVDQAPAPAVTPRPVRQRTVWAAYR